MAKKQVEGFNIFIVTLINLIGYFQISFEERDFLKFCIFIFVTNTNPKGRIAWKTVQKRLRWDIVSSSE